MIRIRQNKIVIKIKLENRIVFSWDETKYIICLQRSIVIRNLQQLPFQNKRISSKHIICSSKYNSFEIKMWKLINYLKRQQIFEVHLNDLIFRLKGKKEHIIICELKKTYKLVIIYFLLQRHYSCIKIKLINWDWRKDACN